MVTMQTSYRSDDSEQAGEYWGAEDAAAHAGRRRWVEQTVLAGVLGAVALALAAILGVQLLRGGANAASAIILGVIVSGAVAGAVQARRLPGYTSAPVSGPITAGIVIGAAGAGGGIAWLRTLQLSATPGLGAATELGAVYAGIALSAALLFAAGLGLLLHTSRLPLGAWSVASELVGAGEALAWAGPAAVLLLFFVACGMGLPLPAVLGAGLGLVAGAGSGFALGRLVR